MVAQTYHSGIIFLKKHVRSRLEHPVRVPHSPGGSGIAGSAPYLRSALSRSCPVLESSLRKPNR